jgi:S-DNA-T family DNA segregation ATPase FtsK/SpoIIIE
MSIEVFLQEVKDAYVRLRQAEDRARDSYTHYQDALKATHGQELQAMEKSFQQARQQVDTDHQKRLETARVDLEQTSKETIARLAQLTSDFRWAILPWDDPLWDTYVPDARMPVPLGVRIGQLNIKNSNALPPLPALEPFIGQHHLFINSDWNAISDARELLQTLVLRSVVSFPVGMFHLSLVDPVGLGANLATFMHLPSKLRGGDICTSQEEIESQLRSMEKRIKDVFQKYLLNTYQTIEQYNEENREVAVPYFILVLVDFPAGFNRRMAERLLNIARNGPQAGVYILATINPQQQFPHDFYLPHLTDLGTTLSLRAQNQLVWNDPEFGKYPVILDSMPPAKRANVWLRSIGRASDQKLTAIPFSRIAIPPDRQWQGKTLNGIRVPIGINSKGEDHFFELGRGGTVVHHGLVGGQTGSGKTNLLHVLIIQLALKYAPEELQLYLVDFKEGVAFLDYTALPHARVVVSETEREFGLSVLQRLEAEIGRRGELFKEAAKKTGIRIEDRDSYCRQTGRSLPRIVLIMDEFQEMFKLDDAITKDAERFLSDLVKRGRAFGIHILLCSQSPSAMMGYILQGKNIYSQMELRIALRCKPQDAIAILGENNDAASSLGQSGEAIYNDDRGDKNKNVSVRIAKMSDEELRSWLKHIQHLTAQRKQTYPPPVTFEKNVPAHLEENRSLQERLNQRSWLSDSKVAKIWLGQPIRIAGPTTVTLNRNRRDNLLIAGDRETGAYGLLLAALLSLAAQQSPTSTSFYIADFTRPTSSFAGLFNKLASALPHNIEVADVKTIGTMLAQLAAMMVQRSNGEVPSDTELYFFINGLHRWQGLQSSEPLKQSESAMQLLRIAEAGPELGLHLVVWTDGTSPLTGAMRSKGIDYFALRAVLRVSESDSINLLGKATAANLEDNYAYFRDADGHMEKFKPYIVPEQETLNKLLKRVALKADAVDTANVKKVR